MSILSTTVTGTHINVNQATANFETKILSSPGQIEVKVTVRREDQNKTETHQHFVLTPQQKIRTFKFNADAVVIDGNLNYDVIGKTVSFSGSLTLPGQFSLGTSAIVVAVL